MLILLLFNILFLHLKEEGSPEIQRVSIHTFYDYSIQINKKNDQLIIDAPQKTFVFITSLLGYEGKIIYYYGGKNETMSKTLIPDPNDRLIYFEGGGEITITATIDDLKFNFHSLKLSNLGKEFDNLYISSSPNDNFQISTKKGSKNPGNCTGNSTFTERNLIWFANDDISYCEMKSIIFRNYYDNYKQQFVDVKYCPIYVLTVSPSENDLSTLHFEKICLESMYIYQMKSITKLIYIETVDSVSDKYLSYINLKCQAQGNFDNQYINYRAYFEMDRLPSSTKILNRGQHQRPGSHIFTYLDGINEFDYSIYNHLHVDDYNSFYIFPQKTEMQTNVNPYEQVFGMYIKDDKYIFKSGSEGNIAKTDFDVKIIYHYAENDYELTNYIVSSNPYQRLKIGSSEDADYPKNQYYIYFLVSLQDIETKVTFTGGVYFKKIGLYEISEIKVNSGDVIKGQYQIIIDGDAECLFETSPVGQLKEGYIDDGFAFFQKPKRTIFFSKNYDVYSNTTSTSKDVSISFKNANKVLAYLPNLFYAQTQNGWSGEILSPVLEDNKIGSKYNRASFYVGGTEDNEIVVMFIKDDEMDDDFELHYRSIPTKRLRKSKEKCDRMIVFNDIPSKFGINTKPNDMYRQIDIRKEETVCMLPAFTYYYYGFTEYDDNLLLDSSGLEFNYYEYKRNDEYCNSINAYYLNGDNGTTMVKLRALKSDSSVIAFIDMDLNSSNKSIGILPDEPKFYSEFVLNDEKGIHPFGENTYSPIDQGNDPKESPSDTSTSSTSTGGSEGGDSTNTDDDHNSDSDRPPTLISVDLTKWNYEDTYYMRNIDELTLNCPVKTLVFVQYLGGVDASVYEIDSNENLKLIKVLNENSPNKMVNFGKSKGKIVVKKSPKSSKSIDNYGPTFHYSYVNVDDVLQDNKCDEIFVSTIDRMNYSIKGTGYQEDDQNEFNYTLSNDKTFCMWFNYPYYVRVNSLVSLPHAQLLFIDNVYHIIDTQEYTKTGSNFFYVLKKNDSNDNTKTAKYEVKPIGGCTTPMCKNYENFNENIQVGNSNGIIGEIVDVGGGDDDGEKPGGAENPGGNGNTDGGDGGKKFPTIIVIAAVVAVVVIVVIIIVVVVIVKRRKIKSFSNEENSDKGNLYP